MRDFVVAEADRIELEVVSGGLFTGSRVAPLAAMPHVAEANQRIAELTGARFGRGYLDLVAGGRFEMDSTAAAIGFAALRAQAPGSALPLAEAMQEAFYRAGDSLSDPATYLRIAEQHELDADRVISDLADPRTHAVALRDFGRAAELGVHSYPTVLLQSDTGTVRLGGAASDAAHLSAVLDQFHSAVTTAR